MAIRLSPDEVAAAGSGSEELLREPRPGQRRPDEVAAAGSPSARQNWSASARENRPG